MHKWIETHVYTPTNIDWNTWIIHTTHIEINLILYEHCIGTYLIFNEKPYKMHSQTHYFIESSGLDVLNARRMSWLPQATQKSLA